MRLGNKAALADVYTFSGLVYESLNQYDTAFAYSQKTLDLGLELNVPTMIVTGYANSGVLLWRIGKPKEALERLQKALSIAAEYNLPRFSIVPLVRISSVLRMQGKDRAREALPYSLRAARIAESVGNRTRKQYALVELAAVYDSLGKFAEAYRALSEALALRDSIFSKETADQSLRLQTLYETERKDNEIALLHKDKQLQELSFRQQRAVQYVLAAALLSATVAAAFFAWLYRQKRQATAKILRQQTILESQTAEIKYANATLQEQNERLQELNQEKNDLLGIVSHDLKNPISATFGLAELLHNFDRIDAKEIKMISAQIMLAAERMLKLVQNLLDANRLESGKIEVELVELFLTPLAESIVAQNLPAATTKEIRIVFESLAPEAGAVLADEQATSRIVDNLLSNAVKYSPRGKNVVVRVKSSAESIRLEVEDEGPGLSQEDKQKLFGKFARLSAKPTAGEHSAGLGLHIAHRLAGAMNGRLWCESELDKGAKIFARIRKTRNFASLFASSSIPAPLCGLLKNQNKKDKNCVLLSVKA